MVKHSAVTPTSLDNFDEANITPAMGGNNLVFVVNQQKQPQQPIHPGAARLLLSQHKAAVWKRYPFTIIFKEVSTSNPQPNVQIKIDPGSKTTGIALVQANQIIWAAELSHRGHKIRASMMARAQVRKFRRSRKTRYRKPKFNNRVRATTWLPPSLESRVSNVITWVQRIQRVCPLQSIWIESVKFDTQLLENPDISGVAYQQGTLQGFEVKQYLLEKYHHSCVYCGITGVKLEIEHVTPKTRGGSSRVDNLVMACSDCNQNKGSKTAAEFGFPEIQAQTKYHLRDAAAVNSTRKIILDRLNKLGLPVYTGTGGQTKYNRVRLGLPKSHWIDAACVGIVESLIIKVDKPLVIEAMGSGCRQMIIPNKFGFARGHKQRKKVSHGFMTGDIVKAVVPSGKYMGTHVGRIAVRADGLFWLNKNWVYYKHCMLIQYNDGYKYKVA